MFWKAVTIALTPAQVLACDLALVLAVDVSGSINPNEYRSQMDGLAAALRDPVISESLVQAQAQVAVVQWTGMGRQRVTVDWHEMTDFSQVARFAEEVANDQRVWRNFATAIGETIDFSTNLLLQQAQCRRLIVDVSGDGVSNEGVEPATRLTYAQTHNVTINALAIEDVVPDLSGYFYENLLTGAGAFVEVAADYQAYPGAIRRKLFREVVRQSAHAEFHGDQTFPTEKLGITQ